MDQCTHEVRKQHWKNIIAQCNQRPEGQTTKQWLDAHGICEQTYYRWQCLIRREIFAQTAPAHGTKSSIYFSCASSRCSICSNTYWKYLWGFKPFAFVVSAML